MTAAGDAISGPSVTRSGNSRPVAPRRPSYKQRPLGASTIWGRVASWDGVDGAFYRITSIQPPAASAGRNGKPM